MIEITINAPILARLRAIGINLRGLSTGGVEVVPAAADRPKAEALVRHGRNVFAVDDAMERAIQEAADAEMAAIWERAQTRRVASATVWTKIGDRILALVRARIDDAEPTPGGKAPLKRPRRDGSTDHIGRDTGALHAGLVRRLVRTGGR